jgi:hypothetical protein
MRPLRGRDPFGSLRHRELTAGLIGYRSLFQALGPKSAAFQRPARESAIGAAEDCPRGLPDWARTEPSIRAGSRFSAIKWVGALI